MKKNTPYTLKRAEHFQVALIGEGLIIGIVSGLVVLLYRVALKYAGEWLPEILKIMERSWITVGLWFVILFFMALAVGKLVKWESLISGSGIPQLEGEMVGKLNPCWWKVLAAKFAGGFLCILGGLSLGREGPSIQLGAMAGKGFSRFTKRGITEERILLTCGASAGLSAAFHAPLAGVMFSLEEVHKNFSVSVLMAVMTASLTADYLSSNFLGFTPVFDFDIQGELPKDLYWTLLILGVILGVLGVLYNKITLKVQSLYQDAAWLNPTTRLFPPFFLAGVAGFACPVLLGSGDEMINMVTEGKWTWWFILIMLLVKFGYSVLCFGSGAPGGIFFPLLVLGAMIGGAFGLGAVEYFGMSPDNVNNYVMLAMAGFFTAIVRAPLTGIILIFEMTGSVSQMLSLSVISIVAYIVANLLGSKPIYESLLENLLKRRGEGQPEGSSERVLLEFTLHQGAEAAGKRIREIPWPQESLLVAIQRGKEELIPRGNTRLLPGDMLVIMTAAEKENSIYEEMVRICWSQQ